MSDPISEEVEMLRRFFNGGAIAAARNREIMPLENATRQQIDAWLDELWADSYVAVVGEVTTGRGANA